MIITFISLIVIGPAPSVTFHCSYGVFLNPRTPDFNVNFKCSYTLTLLLYSGHPFIHCMDFLCVQYNVKLVCLFSGWFDKEANIDNDKQLANFMTQSQR